MDQDRAPAAAPASGLLSRTAEHLRELVVLPLADQPAGYEAVLSELSRALHDSDA